MRRLAEAPALGLRPALRSGTAAAGGLQWLHVRSKAGMVTPKDTLRLPLQTGLNAHAPQLPLKLLTTWLLPPGGLET